MSKSPAFQWYPKDILASARVQEMSLAEEGAYRRLIDYCWINGTIPADPKRVARLIGKGATEEIAKICLEMFEPDPLDPNRMIHERLEEEREKQEHNSNARRKASEARWNKTGKSADGRGKQSKPKAIDANAMQMDMQNDPLRSSSSSSSATTKKDNSPERELSKKKPENRSLSPPIELSVIPEDFELTGEMRLWAKDQQITVDLDFETEKFKNHFGSISGEKAYSRDWVFTWKNWILRGQEYADKQEEKNVNGKKLTPAEIYDSYGYYN